MPIGVVSALLVGVHLLESRSHLTAQPVSRERRDMKAIDEVSQRSAPPGDSREPAPTRWTGVLKRWPTALAIGLTAITLDGGDLDATVVEGYGEALLLLPWPYVIGALLQRRRVAWPALLVGMTAIIALRILDVIAPSAVFVSMSVLLLVWSAVCGLLRRSESVRIQMLGMIGFIALSLVGLAIDPGVGLYVVAAGWFLHGVWDFVHLSNDKVVVRSYAEWCGVVDVLIAAELVFLV
jgi:hypothetical protein